jgi:hypothetical protein
VPLSTLNDSLDDWQSGYCHPATAAPGVAGSGCHAVWQCGSTQGAALSGRAGGLFWGDLGEILIGKMAFLIGNGVFLMGNEGF